MAKNGSTKLRNWICITLGILALAGIFADRILAWGDVENKFEQQALAKESYKAEVTKKFEDVIEDADDLEVEGCKPAKKNSNTIELFKYRFNQVQTTQDNMLIEQQKIQKEQRKMQTAQTLMQRTQEAVQSDTKEILRRLPK